MNRTMPLKAGGTVVLCEWQNETRVTLQSEFAAPPGSSLELEISSWPVSVKVRACRRTETSEGNRFQIEGRFVNLSREQKSFLKKLL